MSLAFLLFPSAALGPGTSVMEAGVVDVLLEDWP